jgi:hypothetical protein
MDYSNERCSLAQQYGANADAILLQIDSYGSEQRFRVTLAGPGVPRGSAQAREGSYRLPGDEGGRAARIVQGMAGSDPAVTFDMQFTPYPEYKRVRQLNGEQRIEESRRDAAFPDYERTIGAIVLSLGSGPAIQLDVHDMASPLAAMRTCVDGLRKAWGLDPAVQKTLSRPVLPAPLAMERLMRNFPAVSRKQGRVAFVPVRMMVDADGNATSCVMQVPGLDDSFKATICDSLRQFQPALDAAGKPVASVFASDVNSLVG